MTRRIGLLSLAGIVAAAVLVLGWWWLAGTHRAQAPGVAHTEPLAVRVAKGAYLARAGNCMNCHTRQGGEPYAGGRAIETPFGIVYSSNLTPDRTHGIGNWTSVDFWRALHEGRAPGGRLLYPAFPYTSFTQVNQDDADALFAYLRSLPAVRQPNRDHAMRWPYVFHAGCVPEGCDTRRTVEPGCLSGSRSGPLQRLPCIAQSPGRRR